MIAAMKTTHNPHRATLITIWAWPLVVLMIVGLALSYGDSLWYLCKSTWALFAGVMQSFVLFTTKKWKQNRLKWYIAVVCVLTIASLLLLPFGLAKWDFYPVYDSHYNPTYVFKMNPYFFYDENIWLSMALHFLVPILPIMVVDGLFNDLGSSFGTDFSSYPGSGSGSSFANSYPCKEKRGSGLWGEKTWLDDVWKGGQVSDGFIGHRGEFDLNDEARRVSEDIQQFHYNHPDADLSDHYYWEDVLDADTDGYLEDV